MRKLLFWVLGALLLVSFTAPAMAETKVEFKGHYRVRYFALHNFNMQKNEWNNVYQEDHRGYFDQRFRLEPKFIVSDCLELHMRIEGATNNRWGHAANNNDFEAWDNAAPRGTRDFELTRIYMVIKTAFGTFRVGRMQCGVFGLNGMGYSGGNFSKASSFALIGPFDFELQAHRIMWSNSWGGFNITVGYQKDIERDDGNTGVQTNNLNVVPPVAAATAGYDDDRDEFLVIPGYTWKNGSANVTLQYIRDRAYNEQGNPGYDSTLWGTAQYGNAGWGYNADGYALDSDVFVVNPAVQMKFGPFSLHAEGVYAWAEMRPDRSLYANENIYPKVNGSGWGVYVDGIYNYGPGEAGAMFSYLSGRNFNKYDEADSNIEGIIGLGNGDNHLPFLVAYDRGLFSRHALMNSSPLGDLGSWNNHWMVGVWNDYNITEDFMVHAAVGYFQLVNVPSQNAINNVLGVGATEDPSKDLGWEFDIGAYYKIMDGLSFTSGFGYFWGGKAWKYGVDSIEVGNAYVWKNQLILSF